ncbi:DoxX family protein [Pseudomonas synxantha BG33R]|uniref:DoxX family protein n=1 Tax=Pseudomonas synxantha TaxID=47883 RepID=UPI00025FEB40|nr:DoxX family protein [Pseudomonas synxantha]EIK67975.1 DoxX family protein [Pseudomonas synxantha BG33R]
MTAKQNAAVMLVARIMLVLIFLLSGLSKIATPDAVRGYMESVHIPGFLLWPTVLFEVGSGLLIMLGYRTRLVALLMAGFSLLTGLIFHSQFDDQIQLTMFLKNISMVGGLLLLAAVGAGQISLDGKRNTV